jgi:hypothetical protein
VSISTKEAARELENDLASAGKFLDANIVTTDPANAVRPVHAALVSLGLRSPLQPALDLLHRVDELGRIRAEGTGRARALRTRLAQEIAEGRRTLDEAALAEFAETRLWWLDIAGPNGGTYASPADALTDEASRIARSRAAGIFTSTANAIFNTVREDGKKQVARLAALPEPPARVFIPNGDALRVLADSKGHEETISVLTNVDSRWVGLRNIADAVRPAAGSAMEHFPWAARRTRCGSPTGVVRSRSSGSSPRCRGWSGCGGASARGSNLGFGRPGMSSSPPPLTRASRASSTTPAARSADIRLGVPGAVRFRSPSRQAVAIPPAGDAVGVLSKEIADRRLLGCRQQRHNGTSVRYGGKGWPEDRSMWASYL